MRAVCLRWFVLGALLWWIAAPESAGQQKPQTPLFEFHSGFWMNLHHFLYRQAQFNVPRNGARAVEFRPVDRDVLQKLSADERQVWDEAVAYYSRTWVAHDLLFDDELIRTKEQLEDTEDSSDLKEAQIAPALKAVLLQAAPIYRKYWWTRHNAENHVWIADLEPLTRRYGTGLSTKLAAIYGVPWPSEPVRVDAVAYANWAGAYTTLYPTRPTISTTDAANQGAAALEIVFHEASHGMVDKVTAAIHAAEAKAPARPDGVPFHAGSLWHGVLFYTAGELVAEEVPGYVPYADKNGLWKRAWPDPDHAFIEKDWLPRVQGEAPLDLCLTRLVNDLAAAAH